MINCVRILTFHSLGVLRQKKKTVCRSELTCQQHGWCEILRKAGGSSSKEEKHESGIKVPA